MAELKNQRTDADVEAFLDEVDDDKRREDCRRVMAVLEDATGEAPAMWGDSMIGFGSYHYVYDSGREGDWFMAGVSPRKSYVSVYILPNLDLHEDALQRLGRFRRGRSCLNVTDVEAIDLDVLRSMVERSVGELRERYG